MEEDIEGGRRKIKWGTEEEKGEAGGRCRWGKDDDKERGQDEDEEGAGGG